MSNNNHDDCGCGDFDRATDEEMLQSCAFLWLVVKRDCKELPVKLTPRRFAQFVATLVNVDYNLIERMIQEQVGGLDFSQFVTTTQLEQAISNIVIPEGITMDQVEQAIVDALAAYSTTAQINALLQDYYTQTQINDFLENQQTQITTLSAQVQSLQQQLDACDCDGSGGTTTTPATIDTPFVNLTDNTCPQCLTRTVANPDNFNLGVNATGNGVVTVSVNNVTLTDISSFVAADGATLEICLTGNDSENVVGGISLYYIDGNGNNVNIDGLSYNVTCPTVNTNSAPTSNGSVADVSEVEGNSFTVDMSGCFNDADGDTLTYAITPQALPTGFSFNTSTGVIMVSDTAAVGTYNFSVVANDGQATSPPCTVEIEVTATPVNAGWATAQITEVHDAGNSDNQTGSSGNDADARLYIGDVETAAPFLGAWPLGVANGGVIDDVTVVGTPVQTTSTHNVSFGDGYITIPSDIPNVTEMRIIQSPTGLGTPLDTSTVTINGTQTPYTTGTWVPVATGNFIVVGYEFPESDVQNGNPNFKSDEFTYEFRYSDGSVISQDVTITASNSDGNVITP